MGESVPQQTDGDEDSDDDDDEEEEADDQEPEGTVKEECEGKRTSHNGQHIVSSFCSHVCFWQYVFFAFDCTFTLNPYPCSSTFFFGSGYWSHWRKCH